MQHTPAFGTNHPISGSGSIHSEVWTTLHYVARLIRKHQKAGNMKKAGHYLNVWNRIAEAHPTCCYTLSDDEMLGFVRTLNAL